MQRKVYSHSMNWIFFSESILRSSLLPTSDALLVFLAHLDQTSELSEQPEFKSLCFLCFFDIFCLSGTNMACSYFMNAMNFSIRGIDLCGHIRCSQKSGLHCHLQRNRAIFYSLKIKKRIHLFCMAFSVFHFMFKLINKYRLRQLELLSKLN